MKALPEVEVDLGVLDRGDCEVRLRARLSLAGVTVQEHGAEVRVATLPRQAIVDVEDEEVAAHPALEAEPVGEEDLLRPVAAEGVLADVDVVHRKEARATDRALEGDVNVVVARLDRELALHREAAQEPVPRVARPTAPHVARVALVDLVAWDVLGVREHRTVSRVLDAAARKLHEAQAAVGEEREVGPEAELVALAVPVDLPRVHGARRVAPVESHDLAIGPAALGGVDGAEAIERTARHLWGGDLPRGVPVGGVALERRRELRVRRGIEREARHAI